VLLVDEEKVLSWISVDDASKKRLERILRGLSWAHINFCPINFGVTRNDALGEYHRIGSIHSPSMKIGWSQEKHVVFAEPSWLPLHLHPLQRERYFEAVRRQFSVDDDSLSADEVRLDLAKSLFFIERYMNRDKRLVHYWRPSFSLLEDDPFWPYWDFLARRSLLEELSWSRFVNGRDWSTDDLKCFISEMPFGKVAARKFGQEKTSEHMDLALFCLENRGFVAQRDVAGSGVWYALPKADYDRFNKLRF